jgi:hypothetical protein
VARQLKGRSEQLRRDHNDRAWLAFHIAGLQRTKKMPPLRRLQIRDRRPQSWQHMKSVAAQLTKLFGGEIKEQC